MDLCEAAERNQGELVEMRWWEQTGLELTGARETASAAAADEDGTEE